MNKELEECKGVVAVLTIDDLENYLWEEQIEELYILLKMIETGRKADGKVPSKSLIH